METIRVQSISNMTSNFLYEQIADKIRLDILEGRYPPGSKLPTVRKMMRIWNCTSGTIQRAYQELSKQGLIASYPGRGTIVSDLSISNPEALRKFGLQKRLLDFLREMTGLGYTVPEIEQSFPLSLASFQSEYNPQPSGGVKTLKFVGSHDLVVEWLAPRMMNILPDYSMGVKFKGSLGGLFALVDGSADLTGCHLWDQETDSYNIPYIQKIFPGEKIAILTLSQRRLGLIIQPGNPLGIASINDITKPGTKFINRQSGSGTRIWLDARLTMLGIEKDHIYGYQNEKNTHNEVAQSVASGDSNVGLGLEGAALLYDLAFIPLTLEKYDLVFRTSRIDPSIIYALQTWLLRPDKRKEILDLGGYDTTQTGTLVWVE